MNPVLRSQRQAALTGLSLRTLAIKARRAGGYAMPLDALLSWNREELIAEILRVEYPQAPAGAVSTTRPAPAAHTTSEGATR